MDDPSSPFYSQGSSSNQSLELEQRILALENENRDLHNRLETLTQNFIRAGAPSGVPQHLPRTALLSDNYLSRAFAVWGHYFVAQLIIAIPIFLIYVIVFVLLLSSQSIFR